MASDTAKGLSSATSQRVTFGLLLVLTAGLFLVDQFMVQTEPALPAVYYAVPIVIAALVLPPRLVAGVAVWALLLDTTTNWLEQAPAWLFGLYLLSITLFGFLSVALSARVAREAALTARAWSDRERAEASAAEAERQRDRARESEELLNRSQEIAHLGSWELDLGHDRLFWSDEVYRIFGLRPQEFGATYEAFLEHVHPDDRAAVDEAYQESLRENRDAYEIEHRVVRESTGEIRFVHEKCEHFRDAAGRILRSVGIVEDVTERKRAEAERERVLAQLDLERKRWGATVDSMLDLLTTCDAAGRVTYVNPAYTRLIGRFVSPDLPLERHQEYYQLYRSDGMPFAPEDLPLQRAALTGQSIRDVEVVHRTVGGQEVIGVFSASPLRDDSGQVVGAVAVGRDVTELARTQEALRQRAEELEKLMDLVPVAIWVSHDPGCHQITGNQAANGFYEAMEDENVSAGPEPGKTVGPRRFFRHGRELRADELPMQVAAARNAEVRDAEFDVLLPSGLSRTLLGTAVPLRDADGQVRGCIAGFMDISERKRGEEALRASEQKFSLIFDRAALPATLSRMPEGIIVDVNEAFVRAFGYTKSEAVGKTSLALNINPSAEVRARAIAELQARGSVRDLEMTLYTKSGESRIFSASLDIVEMGGQRYILNMTQDITERKQAEAERERLLAEIEARASELAFERDRLRTVLESIADAVFVCDAAGSITQTNAAALALLGASSTEARLNLAGYMTTLQLRNPDGRSVPLNELAITRALSGMTERGREEVGIHPKTGRRVDLFISAAPLRDADGRVVGAVEVAADITRVRELADAAQRRAAELDAVNKELEAFSYSVSHDLRAPLRGIDGYGQILEEEYADKLDESGREYLRIVRSESQRMAELIDSMLTLSRITRSELHLEPVDLSALTEKIAADLRHAEPARQVEFSIRPGLVASADSRLIQVALVNLLENAWKFTSKRPRARIEFGASQEGGKTTYFVRDDGAGFDMAYAGKLFGAFQRLHRQSEFPGTGVGLATVQRIIRRHGGTIWAEGDVEAGAAFYFTL